MRRAQCQVICIENSSPYLENGDGKKPSGEEEGSVSRNQSIGVQTMQNQRYIKS